MTFERHPAGVCAVGVPSAVLEQGDIAHPFQRMRTDAKRSGIHKHEIGVFDEWVLAERPPRATNLGRSALMAMEPAPGPSHAPNIYEGQANVNSQFKEKV